MMIERVTQVGGPIPAAFLKRKADDLCVIGQHSFHVCCVEAGIAYFCYLYHVVLSSLFVEKSCCFHLVSASQSLQRLPFQPLHCQGSGRIRALLCPTYQSPALLIPGSNGLVPSRVRK